MGKGGKVKKSQTNDLKLTEKLFKTFLDIHDLEGSNFFETPQRIAKMWEAFLNREKPILKAFPTECQQMVVLKDFATWGFCPHHLLPVKYTFKVGYIPKDKTLGLSKMARLAEYYVSKLPLQEDLPDMIVDDLQKVLQPLGCGCRVEGFHLCMVMRGVKCETMKFVNTALRGVMLFSTAAQMEFLNT